MKNIQLLLLLPIIISFGLYAQKLPFLEKWLIDRTGRLILNPLVIISRNKAFAETTKINIPNGFTPVVKNEK